MVFKYEKSLIMAGKDSSDSASNVGVATLNLKTGLVHKDLKCPLPKTFDGKRGELKSFLTYTELFIGFNSTKFSSETKQVL